MASDLYTTVEQMRAAREALASPVALVPTMGALHAGHIALIERAKQLSPNVIVSIFVNPAQFGPNEDFQQYPRTLADDRATCEALGVTAIFAPTVDEMYPPTSLAAHIVVPQLARDLEATQRPGHFEGVCRVCAKFFNIVQPDVAVFGRKDYQQLRMVEAMIEDLHMPMRIEPVDTVREPDGLALSSRNRYLDDEQRSRAIGLYKALCEAKQLVEVQGETDPAAVERAMRTVIEAHQLKVDYAALRHPTTLGELDCIEPKLTGGVVALVAGRLGSVRLLDNFRLGG